VAVAFPDSVLVPEVGAGWNTGTMEEWKIGILEEWKNGRLEVLENWKIGTSFHYSTIPSFRLFPHYSII
jgi:hypothetical protein